MLDLFRKRGVTSVVYGAIIVATLVVFVIGFRPNAGQQTASLREACAATVRGFCIDPKSQRASYRILIPRDRSGALMTERAKAMGLSRIALDGLIERELLIGEAERLGLTVSEEELTESIYGGFILVSVPSDNPSLAMSLGVGDGRIYAGFKDPKTKQFDLKVYERTIKGLTGRSAQEFREWQGRELLAAKMRDLLRAPVRVADGEAFDRYVGEKSTASIGYVHVRRDYVERFAVAGVTDAQIAAWAKDDTNKSQIKEPTIRHVLVRANESADGGADAKVAARKKALDVIARAKRGEPFEALAKEISEDPGSGANGGDVGTKTDGFVEPFKKAADALKPGEMTPEPVETQFGFHVIKKDDPARAAFLKAKATEAASDLGRKIAQAIKAGTEPSAAVAQALAPFAKSATAAKPAATAADGTTPKEPETALTAANRPEWKISSAFNEGGDPLSEVSGSASMEVIKFAFSAKPGDVRDDLVHTDDGFLVVRLIETKAATRADFDKERDTYIQGMLAAKQAEALVLYTKRLREANKPDIRIDETFLIDGKSDGGAGAGDEDGE